MALQQQLLYYQNLAGDRNATPPELRKLIPKEDVISGQALSQKCELKKRNSNNNTTADKSTPTKRKRSAIFIPPIPTENPNNPATEVGKINKIIK